MVDDEARQGALRFGEKEGRPFLREEGVKRIPPLIELPKLLSAAEHVMEEKDTEEELRMLFAPGSSLGGARPKASIREKDGHLAIAKFPRKDDEINTVVWEAVALSLAQKSGIPVPQSRVENIAGRSSSRDWFSDTGRKTPVGTLGSEMAARAKPLIEMVDLVGIEPTTSSMPWKRAPSCATGPHAGTLRVILKGDLNYSR
jgi:serine/threonine-protein kinase HipA